MPRVMRRSTVRGEASPRAKVWLEIGGRYAFGHGISEILKEVERTGSIKAAAERLGKSYRFVWAKVKETERALGAALVQTQVGGRDAHRSHLTPLARDLVRDFDALRARVLERVDREFQDSVRATLERHCRQ